MKHARTFSLGKTCSARRRTLPEAIPSSRPGWGDTLPTGAPRSLLVRPAEGGDSSSSWHRAQGSGLGVPAWVGEGGSAAGDVAQTHAHGRHFWGRPPKCHTHGASETTDLSSHSPGEQTSGNEVLTGRQCLPELQGRVPPCLFWCLVAPAILRDRGGGTNVGTGRSRCLRPALYQRKPCRVEWVGGSSTAASLSWDPPVQ